VRKFDFAIGNPAYQAETKGENDTYAPPVYAQAGNLQELLDQLFPEEED